RKGPPYKERGGSDLGDFAPLIREVANHDLDRVRSVMDWPLRDAMLAYLQCLRSTAWRNYQLELLVWSALAPHQRRKTDPPSIPRVLRG
ncbi:MAG: hypothetical protein ACRD36_01885, partial [Candidatus Acidiferrum sp.]